eukprot:RCo000839
MLSFSVASFRARRFLSTSSLRPPPCVHSVGYFRRDVVDGEVRGDAYKDTLPLWLLLLLFPGLPLPCCFLYISLTVQKKHTDPPESTHIHACKCAQTYSLSHAHSASSLQFFFSKGTLLASFASSVFCAPRVFLGDMDLRFPFPPGESSPLHSSSPIRRAFCISYVHPALHPLQAHKPCLRLQTLFLFTLLLFSSATFSELLRPPPLP